MYVYHKRLLCKEHKIHLYNNKNMYFLFFVWILSQIIKSPRRSIAMYVILVCLTLNDGSRFLRRIECAGGIYHPLVDYSQFQRSCKTTEEILNVLLNLTITHCAGV